MSHRTGGLPFRKDLSLGTLFCLSHDRAPGEHPGQTPLFLLLCPPPLATAGVCWELLTEPSVACSCGSAPVTFTAILAAWDLQLFPFHAQQTEAQTIRLRPPSWESVELGSDKPQI